MISICNPTTPSHGISRVEPLITRRKLKKLLRAWATNPLTNISRSDALEVIEKFFGFYKKETTIISATGTGSLEITGVRTKFFPDIFSYSPFRYITNLTLQIGLSQLPESTYQLHQLCSLNLANNNLDYLSGKLSALSQLVDVNLKSNQLNSIPEHLHQLYRLKKLDLSYNQITEIPNHFDTLWHLTDLNLCCNDLTDLPSSFSQLKYLTYYIMLNSLMNFPNSICILISILIPHRVGYQKNSIGIVLII